MKRNLFFIFAISLFGCSSENAVFEPSKENCKKENILKLPEAQRQDAASKCFRRKN